MLLCRSSPAPLPLLCRCSAAALPLLCRCSAAALPPLLRPTRGRGDEVGVLLLPSPAATTTRADYYGIRSVRVSGGRGRRRRGTRTTTTTTRDDAVLRSLTQSLTHSLAHSLTPKSSCVDRRCLRLSVRWSSAHRPIAIVTASPCTTTAAATTTTTTATLRHDRCSAVTAAVRAHGKAKRLNLDRNERNSEAMAYT